MSKRCINCPNKLKKCVGKDIECNVTKEELKIQIFDILRMLYKREFELIERNINEVCIASYFWHYFKNLFEDTYINMNIDMEYNKCGIDDKIYYAITGEECHCAKPDFLIHKRSCNKNNFLYLEFKKNIRNIDNDYKKIKAFTKQAYENSNIPPKAVYKYRYGLSIILKKDKVILQWFEDGEEGDVEIILLEELICT